MSLFTWFSRLRRSQMWLAAVLFTLPFSLFSANISFTPMLVADINPAGNSFPDFLTRAGDSLYFYANTSQAKQLFVANQQKANQLTSFSTGTGCISDPDIGAAITADTTSAGSPVFFLVDADSNCGADEIWRTDGTPAGTTLVVLQPASGLFAAGGSFYTLADDGSGGRGIWYSDGSAGNIKLLQGGFGGDGTFYVLGVHDGKLYFVAWAPESSRFDFWQADAAGASLLANTTLQGYVNGAVYQDAVYAAGEGGEVWRLSAGSDTPVLWQDGSAFAGSIVQMFAIDNRLYLIDIDRSRPLIDWTETLWRYDAAADRLDKIVTYSNITAITGMGEAVYFAGETWSDPPQGGTALLHLPLTATTATPVASDFVVGGGKEITKLTAAGDFLYMQVSTAAGWELWVSDGSQTGTRRVTDITGSLDGWESDDCPCLVAAGEQVYFDRQDAATGVELWTLERAVEKPLYLPYVRRY